MISIVALGCYRDVALKTNAFFAGMPYRVVAVADLSNPEEEYQYTAHNLGVILHTLDPPPQVIIIGAGISSSMTDEAKQVFEKYVRARDIDDATVIDLCHDKPAEGDWILAIRQRLTNKYGE